MKTQIFKDYSEFYNREDKEINGVSPYFAEAYPDYKKQNETNEGCWNCSDCYNCSDCFDLKNVSPIEQKVSEYKSLYPVIENIHQKILEAVSKEGALNMELWHKTEEIDENGAYCGTTHCRAGWVVTLAGKEGIELEKRTSTLHAAMQIYKFSSPNIRVSLTRFFESNEKAMEDIKRCAELEKINNNN